MIHAEVHQEVGIKVSAQFWPPWLSRVVKQLRLRRNCTVSIAIVDGRTMRRLNRTYRGYDKVTDVLSFGNVKKPARGTWDLGELIICYPRAAAQAKEQGHSFERELSILLVHGCLHLMGYEHDTNRQADKMKAIEVAILGEY